MLAVAGRAGLTQYHQRSDKLSVKRVGAVATEQGQQSLHGQNECGSGEMAKGHPLLCVIIH